MMEEPFHYKKEIGGGGFGKVWLAIDRRLNSECVVKRIPPDKIINQSNFFDEAQILKKAEHPNIVQVLGTGFLPNGDIYISMEYLKKGSPESLIKNGYVPLRKAVTIMIDILRGLEHAHSKKIIHRDIKPANILIGDAFEGKLSDFGLAIFDIANVNPGAFQSHKYRLHLAPEVRKITDFSVSSDIYACGVTLYRLINGDEYINGVPFESVKELTDQGKFPNRNLYREFIPKSLRIIVNKCLNVKPTLRYRTAEELRRALEKVKILENWCEQNIPGGKRWVIGKERECYEVTRKQSKGNLFDVLLRKGKSKKALRCIGAYCFKDLNKKDAIKQTSKILQGFVTGIIN